MKHLTLILATALLVGCKKDQPTRTVTYSVKCHHCYVAHDGQHTSGQRLWLQGDVVETTRDSMVITGEDTSYVQVPVTLRLPRTWQHTQTLPDDLPFELYVQQHHEAQDTLLATIATGSGTVRSTTLAGPSVSDRLIY